MQKANVYSRSKYRSKRTEINGISFASRREANRWAELCLLAKAGKISDLRRQWKIPLTAHGKLICHYIADFAYLENGQETIEDAKGFKTDVYKLKAKLFEAEFGKSIKEV